MLLDALRFGFCENEQSCIPRRSCRSQGPEEASKSHEESLEEAEEGSGQDVQAECEKEPLPETQLLIVTEADQTPPGYFCPEGKFRLTIGIGGRVTPPPLPHHRTCGSAYGGSADQAEPAQDHWAEARAGQSRHLGKAIARAGEFASRQVPLGLPRNMLQISRGKFDRLRRATAGFTTSVLDGYGLRRHLPLRPPL